MSRVLLLVRQMSSRVRLPPAISRLRVKRLAVDSAHEVLGRSAKGARTDNPITINKAASDAPKGRAKA